MNSISITPSAAEKIQDLLVEEAKPGLMLRVFIVGGGCSGFQYGFKFAEETEEDDLVINVLNVAVVIDSMSMQYLEGAEIDYKTELMGSQFVINNPNSTGSCGCGSSFSVN